jgi:hypothetical protein
MPATKQEEDRLARLHDAYIWEQERIKAWLDDLKNNKTIDTKHPQNKGDYSSDPSNPMVVRFVATWMAYFDEVQASNNSVIGICQAALDQTDPALRAIEVNNAIRRINRIEHRKGSVSTISNAANLHRRQSKYFKSLDAVIDLENEVRDYVEDYLVDGKP